jgi:hypothetical protein
MLWLMTVVRISIASTPLALVASSKRCLPVAQRFS